MKKFCLLLVFIPILLMNTAQVHAANIVTWNSNQKVFNDLTGADFFSDLKTAVPGKKHESEFTIRNRGRYKAEFYFGIEKAAISEELLEEVPLTIRVKGGGLIFEGKLSAASFKSTVENGYSKLPIDLGEISGGAEETYSFVFEFPIFWDNSYINALSQVQWEYGVKQVDTPTEPKDPPPPEPTEPTQPEEPTTPTVPKDEPDLPDTDEEEPPVVPKRLKTTRLVRRHHSSSTPYVAGSNQTTRRLLPDTGGSLPGTGEIISYGIIFLGIGLFTIALYRLRDRKK